MKTLQLTDTTNKYRNDRKEHIQRSFHASSSPEMRENNNHSSKSQKGLPVPLVHERINDTCNDCGSSQQQQHVYRQRRPQQNLTISTTPTKKVITRSDSESPSKQEKAHHHWYFRNTVAGMDLRRIKSMITISLFVLVLFALNGLIWSLIDYYPYSMMETFGINSPETLRLISLTSQSQSDYYIHENDANDANDDDRHRPRNTKIPHILTFTHHINLLSTNLDDIESEQNKVTNLIRHHRYDVDELNELRALQSNVYRIIDLHSDDKKNVTVRFLTDDDCIKSLRQWAYISSRNNHTDILHQQQESKKNPEDIANELLSYFHKEKIGMYKADICRGAALYETGGLYFDVDIGPRMNIFNILLESSEFVTSKVYGESRFPGAFFQAFIAVVPQHEVIHRYIQLFILYYRGSIQLDFGPIGVLLLRRAYDEVLLEQQNEMLSSTTSSSSSTTIQPYVTHLQQTSELWQEILYKPQYHDTILSHVPIPTWGNVRACKYIVVIPPSSPIVSSHRRLDMNTTGTRLIVPLYSRIAGSRRCPSNN